MWVGGGKRGKKGYRKKGAPSEQSMGSRVDSRLLVQASSSFPSFPLYNQPLIRAPLGTSLPLSLLPSMHMRRWGSSKVPSWRDPVDGSGGRGAREYTWGSGVAGGAGGGFRVSGSAQGAEAEGIKRKNGGPGEALLLCGSEGESNLNGLCVCFRVCVCLVCLVCIVCVCTCVCVRVQLTVLFMLVGGPRCRAFETRAARLMESSAGGGAWRVEGRGAAPEPQNPKQTSREREGTRLPRTHSAPSHTPGLGSETQGPKP